MTEMFSVYSSGDHPVHWRLLKENTREIILKSFSPFRRRSQQSGPLSNFGTGLTQEIPVIFFKKFFSLCSSCSFFFLLLALMAILYSRGRTIEAFLVDCHFRIIPVNFFFTPIEKVKSFQILFYF